MQRYARSAICVPLALVSSVALAADEPRAPRGWLAGAAYVRAPDPYRGDVQEVDSAFPLIGYVGERLTWLGPHLSYAFIAEPRATVAAVAAVRFQGIAEDVVQGPLAGLRERRPALEVGADATFGRFFAAARVDVSGRHDGYELSLGVHEDWRAGDKWSIEGRLGVTWQSEDLTRYFYGVEPIETVMGLPAYAPDDALNLEGGVQVVYAFNPRWSALAALDYESFGDEIADSPILADDHQATAFIAVARWLGAAPPGNGG